VRIQARERQAADWAGDARLLLIWGLPAAVLLVSPLVGTRYLVFLWPVLLAFMGFACLANASRCGRVHCYLTGPFMLVLAIVALLHGLAIISIGDQGWWILSVVFVLGNATLTWVPERIFGRYSCAVGGSVLYLIAQTRTAHRRAMKREHPNRGPSRSA
jgi:hypothetical protein